MFKRPTVTGLDEFFDFHPQVSTEIVPLNVKKAFIRVTETGNSSLQFMPCIWKRRISFHKRTGRFQAHEKQIEEHEKSIGHLQSAEAFLLRKTKSNVAYLLDVLGKKGIVLRGRRHKGAHEVNDDAVNHGNFIEIVKLVAESDAGLKEHIDKIQATSEQALKKRKKLRPDGAKNRHGRRSLVTFLSNDIATKIIHILRDFIQENIPDEI
eukprot:gene16400-18037_t